MNDFIVSDCVVIGDPFGMKQLPSDHLDLLESNILICLDAELYSTALASALTVPDICGRLEKQQLTGKINQARYEAWFNSYVSPKYPPRGWPPTGGEAREEDWPIKPGIIGADAYALRNAIVHEGNFRVPVHPGRPDVFEFAFVKRGPMGTVDLTYDPDKKVAFLDIGVFVRNLVSGYKDWNASVGSVEPVHSERVKLGRLLSL